MTSPQKIRANQENSRRSTGPKTAGGKAKSARNSFRHGLSIPITHCHLRAEIEALARRIAGDDASPRSHELAVRIAEAQLDYMRACQTRLTVMDRAVAEATVPAFPSSAETGEGGKGRTAQFADTARALIRIAPELGAIDRYERRALSRRRMAVRAFEAARLVTILKPPSGAHNR